MKVLRVVRCGALAAKAAVPDVACARLKCMRLLPSLFAVLSSLAINATEAITLLNSFLSDFTPNLFPRLEESVVHQRRLNVHRECRTTNLSHGGGGPAEQNAFAARRKQILAAHVSNRGEGVGGVDGDDDGPVSGGRRVGKRPRGSVKGAEELLAATTTQRLSGGVDTLRPEVILQPARGRPRTWLVIPAEEGVSSAPSCRLRSARR